MNTFPNTWNKYLSEKFETFSRQCNVFIYVAAVQTLINREITQLCLQESIRRYIKEVILCCEDVKEPGQYGYENYPNYRPKRKRTPKKNIKKTSQRKIPKRNFSKKKTSRPKKTKNEKPTTENYVNKPRKVVSIIDMRI